MAQNKGHGQSEIQQEVAFQLLISGGSCSIANVHPLCAAGDVVVTTDSGAGLTVITIKNFKGPRGLYNIQATPRVTSTMVAIVSDSYSGDALTFTVSTENDASSATDNVPVDIKAVAF